MMGRKKFYLIITLLLVIGSISLIFIWNFYETETEKLIRESVISSNLDSTVIPCVEAMDYHIKKEYGKVDSFVMTKDIIAGNDFKRSIIVLGLQEFDVIDFIDKRIDVYALLVSGHRLDYSRNNRKRETILFIMTCDNKAIGGYSIPNNNTIAIGGVYSVDGRTLEEVTGLNYPAWSDMWFGKYNTDIWIADN